MDITGREHSVELNGTVNNGEFRICIFKDCSDEKLFIDVNYHELKAIRDAITVLLDRFDQ